MKQARFLARGAGYTLLLNQDGVQLSLAKTRLVSMDLVGAQTASISGRQVSPTRTNYWMGSDPAAWHLNVPSYRSVMYAGVYPGIDLIYHGSGQQLEYDFVVAPHADPGVVRMRFAGMPLKLQGRNLAFQDVDGLEIKALEAYQWIGGKKTKVAAEWEIRADEASIRLAPYDREHELVIDPVFFYGTYIGGMKLDEAVSIVPATQAGYFYVALSTSSLQIEEPENDTVRNPNTTGTATLILGIDATHAPPIQSPLPPYAFGGPSPYPDVVIHSVTYLGGTSGNTRPTAMVGDKNSNLYITGTTDVGANFSSLVTQPCSPSCTGFVAKLSAPINASTSTATITPVYSFGLPATPNAIAVDASGDVYLTGSAFNTAGKPALTIPAADKDFQKQAAPTIGTDAGAHAFLLELDPAGATLFCSYIGGNVTDQGNTIALDGDSVFLAGVTSSSIFPTLNAVQKSSGGGQDGFVLGAANLSSNPDLSFATYLGGSGVDSVASMAVAPLSKLILTGSTTSKDFPIQPPPPFVYLSWPTQNLPPLTMPPVDGNNVGTLPTSPPVVTPLAPPSGTQNAFVTSLTEDGTKLLFTDLLGATDIGNVTSGQAIAVDNVGVIYVTGSSSNQAPNLGQAFETFLDGAAVGDLPGTFPGSPPGIVNIFFSEIDPNGGYLVEATIAGSYGVDQANGLTISGPLATSGTVSIVGSTKNSIGLMGITEPELFASSYGAALDPVTPNAPGKEAAGNTTGFLVQEALAGFCKMDLAAQVATVFTFSGPCVSGTQGGTLFAKQHNGGILVSAPIAISASATSLNANVTIDISMLSTDSADFTFAFFPLGAVGGVGSCTNNFSYITGCSIFTAGGGAGTLFQKSGPSMISLQCSGPNCTCPPGVSCGCATQPYQATVGQPVTLTATLTNIYPKMLTWSSSLGNFSGGDPASPSITFTPTGPGGPVVVNAVPVATPGATPSRICFNTVGAAPVAPVAGPPRILSSLTQMVTGTTFQFSADQLNVQWAISAGQVIDKQTGEYTAPSIPPSPPRVIITATSSGGSATIPVTIVSGPALNVPAAATLPTGGSVEVPISVAPNTGIADESLSFSCAPGTLPSGLSCTFNPNPVPNSGSPKLILKLFSSVVAEVKPARPGIFSIGTPSMVAAAALLLWRRRRHGPSTRQIWFTVLSFAWLALIAACGTNGTFNATSQQGHLTGTYTLTIVVTGNTSGAADFSQTITTATLPVTLR